jgi:hypothetical protein
MISNLQCRFRHLFSGSHELFSKFSIRIPQSAFRNRRPGGTPILFALAALRSVPQAGSQATAIHEISGLGVLSIRGFDHPPSADSFKSSKPMLPFLEVI